MIKCLIISPDSIHNLSNNGIIQKSLFGGFPDVCLRQLLVPFTPLQKPDADGCPDCRLITRTGKVVQMSPLQQTFSSTPAAKMSMAQHLLGRIKSTKLADKFRILREYAILSPFAANALSGEIDDFEPDIIYALVGNQRFAEVVYKTCSRKKFPLYIHITDDYIESLYKNSFFSSYWQCRSRYLFQKITDYATGHAGIFTHMAEEYSKKFGGDWTWFTTLISSNSYMPVQREPDNTIRFLYAGQLGLGRLGTLKKFVEILHKIIREKDVKVQLEILVGRQFLNDCRSKLSDYPFVSVNNWVPVEELPKLFHESDILLHVESFDPTYSQYTRLSFSTKISQYMMAGRCILAIGPQEQGACRAVQELGAGIHLTLDSLENTQEKLQSILFDAEQRNRYAANARQKALELFEIESGQKRFRQELQTAIDRFQLR